MLNPDEIHILNSWRAIASLWERRGKQLNSVVEHCFDIGSIKGLEEMAQFAFNSTGIDASYGGGGGLPAGKHPVTITASSLKPTQDNTGGYIELTLTAIDGPHKGMAAIDRLNMHNKNPKAVEIANKQLAAYCAVTGTPAFNDTNELHNKPFVVEMRPQKDNPQYTEVGALFDMNGNEPGKAGAGPQQAMNNGFGGQQQQQQPNNGFGQQQQQPNQGFQQQQQPVQGFGQQQGGGFGQQQPQGGGFGVQGGGTIPPQDQGQQPQQGGGQWGQQQGQGQPQQPQQQPQQGGGQSWQQQGGGAAGGSPGWGQR